MFNELLHNYILHIFNLDQDFFISVTRTFFCIFYYSISYLLTCEVLTLLYFRQNVENAASKYSCHHIIKVTKYIAALNIYGKIFQLHPREKTSIVVFQLHV